MTISHYKKDIQGKIFENIVWNYCLVLNQM